MATVQLNWTAPCSLLRTTVTLQVVTSPLLDDAIVLPNGTRVANPIQAAAWESFAALGASHARFQPWFPFPHKAVAELRPPDADGTHWDFGPMLPQLLRFMNASRGRPVNMNVATAPCWMFGSGVPGVPLRCTPPEDINEEAFWYGERGERKHLRDASAQTLANYFGRVFEYLSTGSFVDESGKRHSGGPALNLSFAAGGHTWEVFNEAEHGYTPESYTHDYDRVTSAIVDRVGAAGAPAFVGIGGCMSGFWSWWTHGSCDVWVPFFLNASHHDRPAPIDYISVHFYASSSNRSDPST